MKNETLFNETIDILVKAYYNGTLEHTDCQACAVGNIVRETYYNGEEGCQDMNWFGLRNSQIGEHPEYQSDRHLPEIESTGYTVEEISKIEAAFEFGYTGELVDDFMTIETSLMGDPDGFKGLMLVVDCLMKIHECEDNTLEESTKKRFVKVLA